MSHSATHLHYMPIKIAALSIVLWSTGCVPVVGVHGGFSTDYYQGYYTPYPYSGYYSGSVIFPPLYLGRPRRPSIRPFRPERHERPFERRRDEDFHHRDKDFHHGSPERRSYERRRR